MIEKGMLLRCKTKTVNDTFGTVIWEVLEVGLKAPERGRENFLDGVKVVMLGGSGPSAREGLTIIDSEDHILKDIRDGITTVVPADQRATSLAQCQKKSAVAMPRHGGTGVVEM